MKLLLTSAGLTNQTITDKLVELIGKKTSDSSIVYIPTASNVEPGHKDWLIDDLLNVYKNDFEVFDIVDISAISKEHWLPRLQSADSIIFGGGNTRHLMYWVNKSGLNDLLPDLLQTSVYVGISAGSCIASREIDTVTRLFFGNEVDDYGVKNGLGYVDFHIIPHFNSEYFTDLRSDIIESKIGGVNESIYAIDDNTAISIVDNKMEIITEGVWERFN